MNEAPAPEGCADVCDYLEFWRFPKFDTDEFLRVEKIFEEYYYESLPENSTLARKTALLFIKEDLQYLDYFDKNAITHRMIDCYIAAVGDKYAYYRTAAEQEEFVSGMRGGNKISGIGIIVSDEDDGAITVIRLVKDSPAEKAGIKVGDKIVAVNGVSVAKEGYQKTLALIKGDVDTEVSITVKRGDELPSFTVKRALITEQTAYAELLDNNIGYIRITSFKNETTKEFISAVNELEAAGVKGIIFDLTSNTGGYLSTCRNMLSYLVPDGTPLYSMPKTNGGASRLAESGSAYEPEDHSLTVPAVFICNGNTASAAELFCAALRDYDNEGVLKAAGVGTKTFGKGIVQDGKLLSSGAYVTLTIDYYNPPYGENFHGDGIMPDIAIRNESDFLTVAVSKLTQLIISG
jgi:carboxyl-terminal processing protease